MEIKGITHVHSTYSYDAKMSLRELRDFFVTRGIRFACMTEHTDELTPERAGAFVKECEALSDDLFRFIPGFEVPYKRAHVLMIGSREFFGTYAATSDDLLPWARSSKFVVLAHPVRNGFVVDDALLSYIDGLEIWNQQYEGKRVPRVRSLKLFETLRKKKQTLIATGGVDLHRSEHFGAPIITLDVESLTEDCVIEKLKTGAFTISSDHALVYGSLPDVHEIIQKYRIQSHVSVIVIVFGKLVNKVLASIGLSLPKRMKQLVRRRL